MATEKVVNYTPEMTEELVAAYLENPTLETVEEFAEKYGKTVKSIVAKLVAEKVYKAKATETAGKRAVTKAELVAGIAKLAGADLELMGSLEKATSPALKRVLGAMVTLAESVVAERAKVAKLEVKASEASGD